MKDNIQRELLQLKQIVNKLNDFNLIIDQNKKIFGTNWKVTEEFHASGRLYSNEFLEQTKVFSEFNVEIKYPSDDFDSIYQKVSDLYKSGRVDWLISIFIVKCDDHFYGNTEIKGIRIDSSIDIIKESAFEGCSSLTSVIIPSSVTSIENFAFSGCIELTSIAIPFSVTSIGDCAFSDCSSLTSVTIPFSVTSIGNRAFSGCLALPSISIPFSVTSIGNSVFIRCSSLTSITIPSRFDPKCLGITSNVEVNQI